MAKPPVDTFDSNRGVFALLLDEHSSLEISNFVEISESLMRGYAQFTQLGMPGQNVATAMLGATVNLYHMFGINHELPNLLRGLADWLEAKQEPN